MKQVIFVIFRRIFNGITPKKKYLGITLSEKLADTFCKEHNEKSDVPKELGPEYMYSAISADDKQITNTVEYYKGWEITNDR